MALGYYHDMMIGQGKHAMVDTNRMSRNHGINVICDSCYVEMVIGEVKDREVYVERRINNERAKARPKPRKPRARTKPTYTSSYIDEAKRAGIKLWSEDNERRSRREGVRKLKKK
jgi:hypothetical protein